MFQVEIQGFSGPLDLLCHMIDERQIEAAEISVSEVIAIYSAYLAQAGTLSITSIAEFIAQAAHLVRQKTYSLLPQYDPLPEGDDEAIIDDTPDIAELLRHYRPYREAAAVLARLKQKADCRRFRPAEACEPRLDLGDLYTLSLRWLDLMYRWRRAEIADGSEELPDDDGLPAQIPEEIQVENRMDRILERLSVHPGGMTLRGILSDEPGRAPLVVTLLALLELSRRNKITLLQKELFGDVSITERIEHTVDPQD